MAATNAQMHTRPVAIAPASVLKSPQTMPYSCQTCGKRKVKCDKTMPTCSSCRKSKLNCFYEAPLPRRRKRKFDGDVNERLARYEQILSKHGLLAQDITTSPSTEETVEELDPAIARSGKLLTGQGKSRYVDSNPWRNLVDEETQRMYDEEEEHSVGTGIAGDLASYYTTGAFMNAQQSLLQHHPSPAEARLLWKTHVANVEPICKVLHIPSISKMVDMVSQQPVLASRADECLLFAIYHFAVFSMTEDECAWEFGQSRATLMQRYHFATRQAFLNASFLKTTDITVVQALVLFLLPCRFLYDPHTYWILTGIANRISQRIGLHRDGEKLGLPPFEVQMRRRLFYQILPLDGIASQISGTGISAVQDIWDTEPPLNINDDQIWPGMTEKPQAQKGATDMIFCLARSYVGKFSLKVGNSMHGGNNHNDFEALISKAESEVEENYIRYCDIVNPLHLLTIAMARSAITAMRLRFRLSKCRNQTATDEDMKELFQLSQKIIDTDAATCAHTSVSRYLWHVRSFFVHGSWDSLIFFLTSARKSHLLSPAELDSVWSRVEQLYDNHGELLESKQALHIAVRHLTLTAWDANPRSNSVEEPNFITTLRSTRKQNLQSRAERHDSNTTTLEATTDSTLSFDTFNASDEIVLSDSFPDNVDLDMANNFNLDPAEWMIWDQLIKDYQTQNGP